MILTAGPYEMLRNSLIESTGREAKYRKFDLVNLFTLYCQG